MEHREPQSGLALQMSGDIFHQVAHTLCAALPLPVSDSPESRARRDEAAIAQLACLLPANADEANIAAMFVIAGAHAHDWLRRTAENFDNPGLSMQCNARSASMMRQACDAHALLMCVQAQRRKREANPAARDQAAKLERALIRLMAGALRPEVPAPVEQPAEVSTRAQ
jgi:hypothetical protein